MHPCVSMLRCSPVHACPVCTRTAYVRGCEHDVCVFARVWCEEMLDILGTELCSRHASTARVKLSSLKHPQGASQHPPLPEHPVAKGPTSLWGVECHSYHTLKQPKFAHGGFKVTQRREQAEGRRLSCPTKTYKPPNPQNHPPFFLPITYPSLEGMDGGEPAVHDVC